MLKKTIRVFTFSLLAFALVIYSGSLLSSSATPEEKPIVIKDMSHWVHPAKTVFKKHAVELTQVELKKGKTYAIFHVKLHYDPQSSMNEKYFHTLYWDILKANGWWSYSLLDETDHLEIKITWDKSSKTLATDFIPAP